MPYLKKKMHLHLVPRQFFVLEKAIETFCNHQFHQEWKFKAGIIFEGPGLGASLNSPFLSPNLP